MDARDITNTSLRYLDGIKRDLMKENPDPLYGTKEYLMISIAHHIQLISESILEITSKKRFIDTAEPLLRTVFEISINMEWIFIDSKKADRRLKKYFNAPNNRKSIWFGEEWTKSSLKDRMRDVGFETEKKNQEDYYEWVVLPMHDYSHGNVMSLPTPPKYKKRTTENFILQILAQSLQHLLKAYDFAFDEAYPQHKEVLVLINANMRMVRQEDIDNLKN